MTDISACVTVEMPGLKIEVTLIPIERGFQATVRYGVTVWAVRGNFNTVIPDGEAMLPPEVIQSAKLKLWEQIKP